MRIPALLSRIKPGISSVASGDQPPESLPLATQLQTECELMAAYALRHGLPVSPDIVSRIAQLSGLLGSGVSRQRHVLLHELADMHYKLRVAVAPSTPLAIELLMPDRLMRQRFAWLGPVPLIRRLTIAAIGFLCAVLLTGLSAEVSTKNISLGLLDSSGTVLLANALFLLFCAGLGAAFAALYVAHRYIANCTYDPKYDASYSARIILGLIAGLILSEILPPQLFSGGALSDLGKPALAMLGGFSATAVHRFLQRLVETLETLVRGDGSSQYESSLESYKAQHFSDSTQSKNDFAAQLLNLQQSLGPDASIDVVRESLAKLTRSLIAPQYASADQSTNVGAEND
jgi:hypothetical protein